MVLQGLCSEAAVAVAAAAAAAAVAVVAAAASPTAATREACETVRLELN